MVGGDDYELRIDAAGAKVVVNDLGATLDGQGEEKTPADQVVDDPGRLVLGAGGVGSAAVADRAENNRAMVATVWRSMRASVAGSAGAGNPRRHGTMAGWMSSQSITIASAMQANAELAVTLAGNLASAQPPPAPLPSPQGRSN